jgi:hypothetical protein
MDRMNEIAIKIEWDLAFYCNLSFIETHNKTPV